MKHVILFLLLLALPKTLKSGKETKKDPISLPKDTSAPSLFTSTQQTPLIFNQNFLNAQTQLATGISSDKATGQMPQALGGVINSSGKYKQTLDPKSMLRKNTLGGGAGLKRFRQPESLLKPNAPILEQNNEAPGNKQVQKPSSLRSINPLYQMPLAVYLQQGLISPEFSKGFKEKQEQIELKKIEIVPREADSYFNIFSRELIQELQQENIDETHFISIIHDNFERRIEAQRKIDAVLALARQKVVLTSGTNDSDAISFDFDIESLKIADPLDVLNPNLVIQRTNRNTNWRKKLKRHVFFVEEYACKECKNDLKTEALFKSLTKN